MRLAWIIHSLMVTHTAFGAVGLAESESAFVRERATSPVQWMPWGEAALARAKEEHKPVFLVIGEFGHELSRAMEKQTLARAEVAAQLNETFVCVLVDRGEHPDVAALYQAYVHDVKQVPGWPLNVWLTPELKPFEGASYLPPSEEWGQQGFPTVLKRVVAAWQEDPEAQRAKAEAAVEAVRASTQEPAPAPTDAAAIEALLETGARAWLADFAPAAGAFGPAPSFPEPELLRFLLHDEKGRPPALATLRAILSSPLRDPQDGGFFRYAADEGWQQPNRQKALHLQARLALALLEAAQVTGEREFSAAAVAALHFVLEHLRNPAGGYVSLLDASDAAPGAGRSQPLPGGVAPSGEHGLLLAALARAGAEVDDARCRKAAAELFAFIKDHLLTANGGLLRFAGRPLGASPEDHVFVIQGFLAHQSAGGEAAAGGLAVALLARARELFFDATAGRYFAQAESRADWLWARVHVPPPGRGEPPSPECATVIALGSRKPASDAPAAKMLELLVRAVAAEARESVSAPRGDVLLALQRAPN